MKSRDFMLNERTNPFVLQNNVTISEKLHIHKKSLIIKDINFENVKLKILTRNIRFERCSFKNTSLSTNGKGNNIAFCWSIWFANQRKTLVIKHYKMVIFWNCLFHSIRTRDVNAFILLKGVEIVHVNSCSFINITGSMLTVDSSSAVHVRRSSMQNVSYREPCMCLHHYPLNYLPK